MAGQGSRSVRESRLSGDAIVAGAPFQDAGDHVVQGAAYVFGAPPATATVDPPAEASSTRRPGTDPPADGHAKPLEAAYLTSRQSQVVGGGGRHHFSFRLNHPAGVTR